MVRTITVYGYMGDGTRSKAINREKGKRDEKKFKQKRAPWQLCVHTMYGCEKEREREASE